MIRITPAIIEAVAGRPVANDIDRPLAEALTAALADAGITSALEVAHFLAQMGHETGGFVAFIERGAGDGPDADPFDDYLERYDFRKDLGNGAPGDGERYRGRGGFHHTGKANYRALGAVFGVNYVNQPWLLARPEHFVRADIWYWKSRKCGPLALRDDVKGVTRKINGGYNGLPDRQLRLQRAKRALGLIPPAANDNRGAAASRAVAR